MVKRQITKKILKLLDHFPAVAIIGPRQVGKTTLAKSLQKLMARKSVYLDLEIYEDLSKLAAPSLFLESRSDKCIIIDEIQKRPDLFPELRSLIDRKRIPGRFLMLGSASPQLLKQSSESLAGRIAYVELTPLNIEELSGESMDDLWLRGGFPDPFLTDSIEIRRDWFNSFITTYVERDLPQLGLVTSSIQLRRFIKMLAGIHGNLLNQQMLSRSLGVSFTTISRYLDYLENAFLIRRILPYYLNIKKRLIRSPKIYIRDTGLLHHLLSISDHDHLWDSAYMGSSWESFVIQQIYSCMGSHLDAWFYRTQDGTECDLLLTSGNRPVSCIEAKLSLLPSKSKSLTIAIKDLGTSQNFIIVPKCDESFEISENITVCHLKDFVDNFLPKI